MRHREKAAQRSCEDAGRLAALAGATGSGLSSCRERPVTPGTRLRHQTAPRVARATPAWGSTADHGSACRGAPSAADRWGAPAELEELADSHTGDGETGGPRRDPLAARKRLQQEAQGEERSAPEAPREMAPGRHDDVANPVGGALVAALGPSEPGMLTWIRLQFEEAGTRRVPTEPGMREHTIGGTLDRAGQEETPGSSPKGRHLRSRAFSRSRTSPSRRRSSGRPARKSEAKPRPARRSRRGGWW